MRVPLIGTISANSAEIKGFPATDSSARLAFAPSDGVNYPAFRIDRVVCKDSNTPNRNDGIVFEFKNASSGSWEVACTDERLTFWSALSEGVFGSAKVKDGKCTAGHLYYRQIGGLSAGYIDADSPFFSVACQRDDGTLSYIVMISRDLNILRTVALATHEKISAFIERAHQPDEAKLGAWRDFESKLWTDCNRDARFSVPIKTLEKVPLSRMSSL